MTKLNSAQLGTASWHQYRDPSFNCSPTSFIQIVSPQPHKDTKLNQRLTSCSQIVASDPWKRQGQESQFGQEGPAYTFICSPKASFKIVSLQPDKDTRLTTSCSQIIAGGTSSNLFGSTSSYILSSTPSAHHPASSSLVQRPGGIKGKRKCKGQQKEIQEPKKDLGKVGQRKRKGKSKENVPPPARHPHLQLTYPILHRPYPAFQRS